MAHGEAFHIDVPRPRVVEALDSIGREHQIEVERSVADLDEVLAPLDFGGVRIGEGKGEIAERGDDRPAILWRLLQKEVRVLGGVGIPEQDRARFADEGIPDAAPGEDVSDLQRWR